MMIINHRKVSFQAKYIKYFNYMYRKIRKLMYLITGRRNRDYLNANKDENANRDDLSVQ